MAGPAFADPRLRGSGIKRMVEYSPGPGGIELPVVLTKLNPAYFSCTLWCRNELAQFNKVSMQHSGSAERVQS